MSENASVVRTPFDLLCLILSMTNYLENLLRDSALSLLSITKFFILSCWENSKIPLVNFILDRRYSTCFNYIYQSPYMTTVVFLGIREFMAQGSAYTGKWQTSNLLLILLMIMGLKKSNTAPFSDQINKTMNKVACINQLSGDVACWPIRLSDRLYPSSQDWIE